MSEHIGELAELYAAGALDDAERAQVDAHIASCTQCAARVGESEATVAALVMSVQPSSALDARIRAAFSAARPRSAAAARRPRIPLAAQAAAIAAAFVLGFVPAIYLWGSRPSSGRYDAQERAAVVAMVHGHFLHAAFVPATIDAPAAKVIYGRPPATWLYFVAQTRSPLTVAAIDARGRATPIGRLTVDGDAAQLFVSDAHGARAFALMDGARRVARVGLR